MQAYLGTLSLPRVKDLQKEVDAALERCQDSNRHMAVYRGGVDLAQRIRAQSFDKDKTPLRPHKVTDSLHRLHERLGCHKQYSIPIGFFYAKWSEKLHFHLSKLRKQERSHSSSSSSRSRTPSPKGAPTSTRSAGDPLRRLSSPEPNTHPALHPRTRNYYMEKDAKARDTRLKGEAKNMSYEPKIAFSSATGVDMSIETAEDNLNDLRLRRAAIFDETKDGLLRKEDKAVFWYRQGRRQGWQAVASETMMNESEWNDQYDQVELEKLRFTEEQLETLLEEHKKSIGYGPAGQGSN